MVARVLMQGGARSALKVSLPGFDVTNPTSLLHLAFDAEGAAFRVLARGQFNMAPAVQDGTSIATINFPGQARPPFCSASFQQVGTTYALSPWRSIDANNATQYASVIVSGGSATFQMQHTQFQVWTCRYCFFVLAD